MKTIFSKLLFSLILLITLCPAIGHQAMASTMEGDTDNLPTGCTDSMRREMLDCCENTPSKDMYLGTVDSNNNHTGKTPPALIKSSIIFKAERRLNENLPKKILRISNPHYTLMVKRE